MASGAIRAEQANRLESAAARAEPCAATSLAGRPTRVERFSAPAMGVGTAGCFCCVALRIHGNESGRSHRLDRLSSTLQRALRSSLFFVYTAGQPLRRVVGVFR